MKSSGSLKQGLTGYKTHKTFKLMQEKKSLLWITKVIIYIHTEACQDLLLGFFAHTIADGGLGSPDPDSLIAVTLNSYSEPSVISLTAYFMSGKI